MFESDDPFDRAVRRETAIHAAMRRRFFDGLDREVRRTGVLMGAGWLFGLLLHWALFPRPRWLVVAHSVLFLGAVIYGVVMALAHRRLRAMLERRGR